VDGFASHLSSNSTVHSRCTIDESRGLLHRLCHESVSSQEATKTSTACQPTSRPCSATRVESWQSIQDSILRVGICLAGFLDVFQKSDAFCNGVDRTHVLFLLPQHHRCDFSMKIFRPKTTVVHDLRSHHEPSESNAGVCSQPVRRSLLRCNAARRHSARCVEVHASSFRSFAVGTPTLDTYVW